MLRRFWHKLMLTDCRYVAVAERITTTEWKARTLLVICEMCGRRDVAHYMTEWADGWKHAGDTKEEYVKVGQWWPVTPVRFELGADIDD